MRKIESGSNRMSKPFGAVAPPFKPSVPLFYGGCTVLSIQPSTSVLSEKALAALKYAFLQNKKVGIAGAKVDSLKPPCNYDLQKAEAAYSIARELVEWSEKFEIHENPLLQDDACLETKDDHKMSDKVSDYGVDLKDDFVFGTKKLVDVKDPEIKTEIKDPEIKDPEIKLEMFGDFKENEFRSNFPFCEKVNDLVAVKAESVRYSGATTVGAQCGGVAPSRTAETLDFLKDTSCDGLDFFKSEDTEFDGINFLSCSTTEPMNSLDDLTQHTVDIDLAFPVPPLPLVPTVFSKVDSDHDVSSPIESPQSPFLLSPISISPSSPFPSFPDS